MSLDQDTEVTIKARFVRVIREHTGFNERLATAIASEAWGALVEELRGDRIYVSPSKAERDAEVLRDFDGTNHDQVCRDHKISRPTLYRILNSRRKKRGTRGGP